MDTRSNSRKFRDSLNLRAARSRENWRVWRSKKVKTQHELQRESVGFLSQAVDTLGKLEEIMEEAHKSSTQPDDSFHKQFEEVERMIWTELSKSANGEIVKLNLKKLKDWLAGGWKEINGNRYPLLEWHGEMWKNISVDIEAVDVRKLDDATVPLSSLWVFRGATGPDEETMAQMLGTDKGNKNKLIILSDRLNALLLSDTDIEGFDADHRGSSVLAIPSDKELWTRFPRIMFDRPRPGALRHDSNLRYTGDFWGVGERTKEYPVLDMLRDRAVFGLFIANKLRGDAVNKAAFEDCIFCVNGLLSLLYFECHLSATLALCELRPESAKPTSVIKHIHDVEPVKETFVKMGWRRTALGHSCRNFPVNAFYKYVVLAGAENASTEGLKCQIHHAQYFHQALEWITSHGLCKDEEPHSSEQHDLRDLLQTFNGVTEDLDKHNEHAEFSGVAFDHCTFSRCWWGDAKVEACEFRNCFIWLRGKEGKCFAKCKFFDCSVKLEASFNGFKDCKFTKCLIDFVQGVVVAKCQEAGLEKHLESLQLTDCTIMGRCEANLHNVKVESCTWKKCDLSNLEISGVEFKDTTLGELNLSNVTFKDVSFSGCSMKAAKLQNSQGVLSMLDSSCEEADFTDAMVANWSLDNCIISNATFTGTQNFDLASWYGCIMDGAVGVDTVVQRLGGRWSRPKIRKEKVVETGLLQSFKEFICSFVQDEDDDEDAGEDDEDNEEEEGQDLSDEEVVKELELVDDDPTPASAEEPELVDDDPKPASAEGAEGYKLLAEGCELVPSGRGLLTRVLKSLGVPADGCQEVRLDLKPEDGVATLRKQIEKEVAKRDMPGRWTLHAGETPSTCKRYQKLSEVINLRRKPGELVIKLVFATSPEESVKQIANALTDKTISDCVDIKGELNSVFVKINERVENLDIILQFVVKRLLKILEDKMNEMMAPDPVPADESKTLHVLNPVQKDMLARSLVAMDYLAKGKPNTAVSVFEHLLSDGFVQKKTSLIMKKASEYKMKDAGEIISRVLFTPLAHLSAAEKELELLRDELDTLVKLTVLPDTWTEVFDTWYVLHMGCADLRTKSAQTIAAEIWEDRDLRAKLALAESLIKMNGAPPVGLLMHMKEASGTLKKKYKTYMKGITKELLYIEKIRNYKSTMFAAIQGAFVAISIGLVNFYFHMKEQEMFDEA